MSEKDKENLRLELLAFVSWFSGNSNGHLYYNTHDELINDVWAVEVPGDAHNCQIVGMRNHNFHCQRRYPNSEFFSGLPTGQWSLIGISDELSEEQAAGIVGYEYFEDDDSYKYWHFYTNEGVKANLFCETAIESFQSLLKSKSLTARYAIIKKEG